MITVLQFWISVIILIVIVSFAHPIYCIVKDMISKIKTK